MMGRVDRSTNRRVEPNWYSLLAGNKRRLVNATDRVHDLALQISHILRYYRVLWVVERSSRVAYLWDDA